MVVMFPIVVSVVLVSPIAFMNMPSVRVVVVVGMSPKGTGVGRPAPLTVPPYPSAILDDPVAIDPHKAGARRRRRNFIAIRRRRGSDGDSKGDLPESRDRKG